MKKIIFLVAIATLFSLSIFAQDYFDFQEKTILIEGVSIPVLIANMETDEGKLQKEFIKYIEEKTKLKVKKEDNYFKSKEGPIYQVSDKRGHIIILTHPEQSGINLCVGVQLGPDVYVSSSLFSEEFEKLTDMLNKFSYNYMLEELDEKLKLSKSDLHSVQKRFRKSSRMIRTLNNKAARSNKKIEKFKKKDSEEKVSVLKEQLGEYNASLTIENINNNDLKAKTEKLKQKVAEYQKKYEITQNKVEVYGKEK
jgi:hypothetical protein